MLEAIKQRQSIRKYQNTPVETEKINSLLEALRNGNLLLLQIVKL